MITLVVFNIGSRKRDGGRKQARFPIHQWSVHDSTMNGKYFDLCIVILFSLNSWKKIDGFRFAINIDKDRTNNVCEGWHSAFASTSGKQRPCMDKFIGNLKDEESLARQNIASALSGLPAAPPPRKVREQNEAKKNALQTYMGEIASKPDDSDGEEEENNNDDEYDREIKRQKWMNGPEMKLLKAIATHSRLSPWFWFQFDTSIQICFCFTLFTKWDSFNLPNFRLVNRFQVLFFGILCY